NGRQVASVVARSLQSDDHTEPLDGILFLSFDAANAFERQPGGRCWDRGDKSRSKNQHGGSNLADVGFVSHLGPLITRCYHSSLRTAATCRAIPAPSRGGSCRERGPLRGG